MLAISAFVSLFLVLGAFIAARSDPHPIRWGAFFGFAIPCLLLQCIGLFLPIVCLLALLLGIALRVWQSTRKRWPTFVPLALSATAIAYGIGAWLAITGTNEYTRMREKYPFESMETRLPVPTAGGYGDVTRIADESMAVFELALDQAEHGYRSDSLRSLHEDRFREFTNATGFGVTRMMPLKYRFQQKELETPAQPGRKRVGDDSHAIPLSATDEPDLRTLHTTGTVDFVNPPGFGYVKDRAHVAGFLGHGFSNIPEETPRWAVDRIDLIGLLLHPEPVAYVSDKLPAMDELRKALTRKLDAFESAGLETIRNGQLLFVSTSGEQPRMVGAIRSVRQCVGCHGGERGDLLGAFSYTLRPVEKKP